MPAEPGAPSLGRVSSYCRGPDLEIVAARDHLAQAREMAEILGQYGLHVDVLRTRRPGYVVYEDRFQVGAHPFADTPT